MSIYVIGACSIDISANILKDVILKDSNPCKINLSVGGVGHNVAKNISNLDEEVYFISLFSNDNLGKLAYQECLDAGFNLKYSKIIDNQNQSLYMAILDTHGDMAVGFNDMDILNNFNIDNLNELKSVIKDDDYLMVDNNLSEELSNYIFKEFKGIKFTDAISVNKVNKLYKSLAYIDILKVNIYELEALVNRKINNEKDIYDSLIELMNLKTSKIIVTNKEGLYLAYNQQVYHYKHNNIKDKITNATGAGDALLGAYVASIYKNNDELEAIKDALMASLLTIDDIKTVADINISKLKNMQERELVKGEIVCY